MTKKCIIAVVGNPNCGKTTLFNALTGAKQRVGNWPGVTVERKTGRYHYGGTSFELVDLPGTYSLDVSELEVSVDEQIARDYVAARESDLIINIVDASNIERNLYLTAQLIEMKIPMVIALNMMDIAEERSMLIDVGGLSEQIGCPVIPVVASKGKGITELKQAILKAVKDKPTPQVTVPYAPELEQALEALMPEITPVASQHHSDPRWLAVRLLEGDTLALKMAGSQINKTLNTLRENTEKAIEDDLDISIADSRYGFVDAVTKQTITKASQVKRSTSDKIDRVVLNRALGIPIFLAVMYLMFMFTINIGGAFIDFFDMFTTALLVDGLGEWMNSLGSPEWLAVLVANGIGGGIVVVATFIPIIGFLYLFLSVLEDSGYTARAAFVMDRFMRFIGLPGKAFVPMMVGFGCNVPAIMATRTMEHQRDRILTILMNPFMSCGARLPVYALFAAAFFPVGGQNLVFGLYSLGIAAAVMTGLIMKNTVLQGETAPFVMELPPYHLPTFRGVVLRTWDRLKTFIFRAGKVIVPMVLVINFLNALGTDGSFGNEDSDASLLSEIGREIVPAFSPMGLEEDNWPAAVGIFTGVLAKEVVVGTLDALYTSLAESDARAADRAVPEEEAFDLWARISEALATIPANLVKVAGMVTDPLGLDIGDVSNIESAAEAQEVSSGTFGAMQARFDGQAGAFSYLLFILLYFPCVAATAAVYREAGMSWTIFVAAWTTGLAYMTATIFYQAATMSQHLNSSATWIGGMLAVFIGVILALRYWSRRPGTTQLSFPGKA
jgi:ferrous iron transport protein B